MSQQEMWDRRNGYRTIYHSDKEQIVDLFVGKSVKKITDDQLVLSDGTVLQIVPNEGGCSCGAGDYELTELNEVENIITNVELVESSAPCNSTYCSDVEGSCYCETDQSYEIFVLAGDRRINLLRIDGNDGNGYYGTGFWIKVVTPSAS